MEKTIRELNGKFYVVITRTYSFNRYDHFTPDFANDEAVKEIITADRDGRLSDIERFGIQVEVEVDSYVETDEDE